MVRRLHQHYGLETEIKTACMTSLPPPACCRIPGRANRQPPEPANPAGLKPAVAGTQAAHRKPAQLRLGWDEEDGMYWNLMRNNGGSYERTVLRPPHHKLKIRGLKSPVDVLTFTATNSSAHPSATTFSLPVPINHRAGVGTDAGRRIQPDGTAVQGMPVQAPLRTLHGVITGFNTSHRHRTKPVTKCALNPVCAAGPQPPERHLPEPDGAANFEKILRERHQMRGQDFVFNLKANTRPANR